MSIDKINKLKRTIQIFEEKINNLNFNNFFDLQKQSEDKNFYNENEKWYSLYNNLIKKLKFKLKENDIDNLKRTFWENGIDTQFDYKKHNIELYKQYKKIENSTYLKIQRTLEKN